MPTKQITAMAIAGLMTLGVVGAMAQGAFVAPATPEEAVAMRKELMRVDGGILRGADPLAGPEAIAAMQLLKDNLTHIPALFPEGSIVGDSEALPAIWENWETFVAIAKAGEDAVAVALAAAEAGDAGGYAAALQAIGGTCGQCHQQFRV